LIRRRRRRREENERNVKTNKIFVATTLCAI